MSKILVCGGAGFIGSHLVNKLRTEDHEVFVVDDLSGGSTKNIQDEDKFEMIDLRDGFLADEAIERIRPEIVFHLACQAAENKAQFSPIDITSRSYSTFINTLTPFIKYGGKRFVFTSSIAVYGALQTPFKETDKPEPEDLYGITKLACEQTLKIMSQVHNFEYVIARPHNVYGPRQNMKDPYRNVVTIWMNQVLKGQGVTIYGNGEQRRCFSYIDDVVEALYKCGFEDVVGKTFNIGSDKDYSLNQLANAVTAVNFSAPREYLPERSQEVKVAIADHTQCKNILGYHETPLEEGIEKTWEWVKSIGPVEPVYSELELINDKVPQNWIKS